MANIILKDESYLLVCICMEVHTHLGMGFKEVLYKDAIEIELKEREIHYKREREFRIEYKEGTAA